MIEFIALGIAGVGAVIAGLSARDARKSRRAAEESAAGSRRERNRPRIDLTMRETRQVVFFALRLRSDRALEWITVEHQRENHSESGGVFAIPSGIAPESPSRLRFAAPEPSDNPQRNVAPTKLVGGPIGPGDDMDLLFRSVGYDPRPKITLGAVKLLCTCKVPGEPEPYVFSLDTGPQALQTYSL